jgi:hypothetical protein
MTTLSNGESIYDHGYDFSFGDVKGSYKSSFNKSKKDKNSKYDDMFFMIEQFFNSDMITSPLFNATILTIYISMLMFHKFIAEYFLDWD